MKHKVIDIHTHGIGGYDTRTTLVSDIRKMAEMQASTGVTRILPTVYPSSIEDMRNHMTAIKEAMETSQNIIGIHLEGPFLNPERSGALNPCAFIEPTEYNLRRLIEGFEDTVKIITIAPEIKGALKLIRHISDMGIVVSMGHSDATYSEAEAGFNAGARSVTHIFNAMRGFHHREPGIAGFGLLHSDIYIEAIADPYHLHTKTLELIFRLKRRDRIILVSDSVKETNAHGGSERAITDRGGTLQGGAMTVVEASRRLIAMGFDEDTVRDCISRNPEMCISVSS